MTDREKLVELIKSAKAAMREKEFTCNLEREYFMAEYMISHGVTVKEPQKPLTVEELMEIPGSVWFENDTAIAPMMVSKKISFSDLCIKDVVFGLYRRNAFNSFTFLELTVSEYGKTWRCWKEKPTEEERKAAEWEQGILKS